MPISLEYKYIISVPIYYIFHFEGNIREIIYGPNSAFIIRVPNGIYSSQEGYNVVYCPASRAIYIYIYISPSRAIYEYIALRPRIWIPEKVEYILYINIRFFREIYIVVKSRESQIHSADRPRVKIIHGIADGSAGRPRN